MRYPDFIKKNDRIAYIAPSFGCTTEPYRSCFNNAIHKMESIGFLSDMGVNCFEDKGVGISNTPIQCAAEFMNAYSSENNNAIISVGGGELMCEILPYIDFYTLANMKPKWFMGFSDNANLTFLLNTICDVASVYGPCAQSFGMENWHPSHMNAIGLLTGDLKRISGYGKWERESLKTPENPLCSYNLTEDTVLKKYIGRGMVSCLDEETISFSGRLIGGCLDVLTNLAGTKFDVVVQFNEKYSDDGIIWFLESCDLNVFDMRRAMWHLDQCGWFKYVKGFIIGRPLDFNNEMMGLDQYTAILDVASKFDVPVIMDADLGHLPPSMPLISGSFADVNVKGNDIDINFRFI
ncbi:MAG: LD-carboxypeptidase [Lachnospiraceae bacterium]|nr:LD-carboxypeptidase [Lachnospiraceae bacterium]